MMALLLTIALLAMGAIAAASYLPTATIAIHPTVTARTIEQDIILSTKTQEPDFTRFILPATQVEKEINVRETIQRESTSATEDFARGNVVLKNTQPEEQNLLPKTHLRHEATGTFFLTDAPVSIPPEGETSVTVTAKEKGPTGDVPPGKFIIDKLPAASQALVWAESTQPFSGGHAADTALTQEEIDAAVNEAVSAARERARGELTLAAGGAPLRDDLITVNTSSQTASVQAGQNVTQFTVDVTATARGFVVDENNLLSLTVLALRSKVEPDEEFLSYDPNSFSLTIERAAFDQGEVQVKGQLTGSFGKKISPSLLTPTNIAGLSASELTERFENLPNVEKAEVQFSPFWVTSAPSRPEGIEVKIVEE